MVGRLYTSDCCDNVVIYVTNTVTESSTSCRSPPRFNCEWRGQREVPKGFMLRTVKVIFCLWVNFMQTIKSKQNLISQKNVIINIKLGLLWVKYKLIKHKNNQLINRCFQFLILILNSFKYDTIQMYNSLI